MVDSPWIVMLSVIVLVSALLAIQAEYAGARRRYYVFKPLTTVAILTLALERPGGQGGWYALAVAVGLTLSLAGDVFLMLPGDRFVAGLGAFFLAHVAYIAAFAAGMVVASTAWPLLALAAFVVAMTMILWPRAGALKWPVLAYELIIVAMAWRAWERWAQTASPLAFLALAGALLFVVSDSALALNRFARPFHGSGLVVLSSYYVAQWLIAMSVG